MVTENGVPEEIEEERTVPDARRLSLAELMEQLRRRQPNGAWDVDNGVDDRGGR